MIIDNPEALRIWLEGYLPPLCDADPEVLAKYCLALIRKDRRDEDLKSSMVEALDVFLKDNTNTFVDVFLSVVKSKSYLPKPAKTVVKEDSPVKCSTNSMEQVTPEFTDIPGVDPALVAHSTVTNSASPTITQPPLPTAPPPDSAIPHPPPEFPPSFSPLRKEEGDVAAKPRKEMDRDDRRRKRSNSRLRDRPRRSRSRGRTSRNKYDDRRRRSPHTKRYRRSSRSRSLSPRRSRSPVRRSRSRERRSRSPKSSSPKRLTRHRSRSRSPLTKPSNSPSKSPSKDDLEESNSKDAFSEKDNQNTTQRRHSGKYRCRDYDEQGFCLRGHQCPFDHGSDPVVLEGAALEFPPPITSISSQSANSYMPHPPSNIGGQEVAGRPLMPHPPPSRGTHIGEYTPNNPGIWSGDAIPNVPMFYGSTRGRGLSGATLRSTAPHSVPPPDLGRELINVPVDSNSNTKLKPPVQRFGPIHSNGSFNIKNKKLHRENFTLELKKIPSGMNTIALINQHFSKFGSITNIQIHNGADPEAALVTFSNSSEASAAYRSTEAVLNNRFIKLFWHNPQKSEISSVNQRNIHDRLGNRHPNKSLNNKPIDDNSDKVVLTRGGLVKTVYNYNAYEKHNTETNTAGADSTQQQVPASGPSPEEIKKLEIETICKQQELLKAEIAAQNKKEKKKADAIKLKTEVELRTRQLLYKQMAQVKVLVNKLDVNRANMKPEEIKSLLGTIKSLQSAVDATKARLFPVPVLAPTVIPPTKSKTQLHKEILDTELELYNVQSEGGDITALRSRMQLLKVQVGNLKTNLNQTAPRFPIQRAHRPIQYSAGGREMIRGVPRRGRGRGYMTNHVDRRSTTIHVSGFEKEDKADVLAHFGAFGPVTNYLWDRHTPSISVQFSVRRDAEKAMTEGRNLEDRLLTLTWTKANPLEEAIAFAPVESDAEKTNFMADEQRINSTTTSTHDDAEEITEEIIVVEEVAVEGDDEMLLYDDDDESEGRSWRR